MASKSNTKPQGTSSQSSSTPVASCSIQPGPAIEQSHPLSLASSCTNTSRFPTSKPTLKSSGQALLSRHKTVSSEIPLPPIASSVQYSTVGCGFQKPSELGLS
ncbi:hypothetical protein NEOLI_002953 [Neolecta irregularis DAH-3]|uniref:Uncharacterized protein n=1 Tax=Neolecta irregularis (strain DAH-3) TaxID=1198029 RepID=A0A1U7LPY5_NEOID|nr:hypothetical protein NEOLI_002953 [Neolecta irregularis DAH-3]|eukprot:OLL24717.1 hypothetical protein NEOLI_002953 [Neolecta irregularis DAH-3]